MAKKIALFNHKGGVSKTTTALHLAWMLARKQKRVLMVDADPQCNLTGLLMGYKGLPEFEKFYLADTAGNIRAGLAPAFESRPKPLTAVSTIEIPNREGLFLLPGHLRLSEYEVTLGIAQELSAAIQTLQNLPGAISFLINETATSVRADYVVIDMNPSLSAINQNILMTSDYFLIPASPDFFSVLALDSLSAVIPRWRQWALAAQKLDALKNAAYPFPAVTPKFLGTVIQKYRPRRGRPTIDFQRWIDEINKATSEKLAPLLSANGMLLSQQKYLSAGLKTDSYNLSLIPDFNTLIAKSQKARTPVFALTKKQMERGGVILEKTIQNRDSFKKLFSDLADTILSLTGG